MRWSIYPHPVVLPLRFIAFATMLLSVSIKLSAEEDRDVWKSPSLAVLSRWRRDLSEIFV